MEYENKYRRWAWGALIGLAAVIIVAGFIIAVSLTSPKPNTDVAKTDTNSKATAEDQTDEKTTEESAGNDNDSQNDSSTETKPEATQDSTSGSSSTQQGSVNDTPRNSSSNIPKTGPEDAIIPIIALAASAYLVALNISFFKKNA